MVYTVTMNPSLDYTVDIDNFTKGEINRTKKEQIFAGGKGINVSLVLKNLGMDSTALGFTAGFTGDEITRMLAQEGIRTNFIRVAEGFSRINVKIRSGEETAVNGQGPVVTEGDLNRLYEKLKVLKENDVVVLSGNIPACLPPTIYRDITASFMESGVKAVVDAEGDSLTAVLPYGPFLIKPNHHELEDILGCRIESREKAVECARILQEQGAKNVFVSMAGQGAVLVAEDGTVCMGKSPEGKLVNSVGAGDSCVAGFIYGYLTTHDYKKAFCCGVCAGSASAFSETLATGANVSRLLDSYRPE